MSALTVTRSGPRATIQDLGRSGFQHQGLSPGGAADLRAFRWANHLLDNPGNAACLEITFGGFMATADQSLLMAITGADCRATVNEVPIPHWGVFSMAPGDRLRLDTPRTGLLTYLAVTGGWQTRKFCNSRSCVVREGLSGLGPLGNGVTLPADHQPPEPGTEACLRRLVPPDLRPVPGAGEALKVMPGPDLGDFHHVDRARFIHSRYHIGDQSDRMGYRLDGPALPSSGGVTSRGVCLGTVQVPGDGRPMVLLNDRQTIGGYPVLGTLPRLDCSLLAQKRPGEPIGFQWSDVATCQSEYMMFERMLKTSVWLADGSLSCPW